MLNKITNVIHVRHFLYLVPFVLFAFLVIYTARLLKYYLPNRSIGFNVIVVLSTFVNWFFINDYLVINPIITWGILLLTIVGFSIYTYKRFKPEISISAVKKGTNRDFLKLTATYLIGIALICVPLLFFIPKNVIVVGDGVSSDIIQHSVFTQGYEHSNALNIVKDEGSYPRAFHSTMYYINQFINFQPAYVVLLGLIIFYAFIVFAVDEILYFSNLKNRKIRYLLMLLPVVPYLMLATLYNTFAPHIVSVPFIIIGLFAILNLDFKSKYLIRDFLLIGVITLATFNIYSIFALNVLVAGLVVKIVWELFNNRNRLKTLISSKNLKSFVAFNKFGSKSTAGVFGLLLLGIVPAIPLLYTTYIYTKTMTGFLLTSNGNLSNFLSPFHLTGIWLPDQEYRTQLSVWATYIFIAILAVQLFFLFRAKLTNSLKTTFGVLLSLNILGVIFINNRYVEFKYITFFIPIFILVFGMGVVAVADTIKNRKLGLIFSGVALVGFIALALIPGSMQYKQVPTINADGKFNTLLQLKSNYFDTASVLYVGYDDWTIYFRDSNEDYFPTLGYLHNKYNNEPVKYFIVDPIYVEDIDVKVEEFLNKHPELQTKLQNLNQECITTFLNRYTIYDLECE